MNLNKLEYKKHFRTEALTIIIDLSIWDWIYNSSK